MEHIKKNIEKQIENPDWVKIEELAKLKLEQFSGLVSQEGALHIAVQELYPDYKASKTQRSGAEIKGRLINKTKPRIVDTKSGKQPIRDVFIATIDTGILQSTLWGKARVELFKDISHGDAITLKDVKVSSKDGETVLNFFDNSSVEKIDATQVKALPEMLEPLDLSNVKKSRIGSLKGLIIQTNDIEYKICPVCNGRLSEVEDTFICQVHNEVQPVTKNAKEITVDTGKGIISTVLWPELLKDGDEPKQLDMIDAICRVYDGNYYAREKARAETEATNEVLAKQFPRNMRLTIYSYDIKVTQAKSKSTSADSDDKDSAPVEEKGVKD